MAGMDKCKHTIIFFLTDSLCLYEPDTHKQCKTYASW